MRFIAVGTQSYAENILFYRYFYMFRLIIQWLEKYESGVRLHK